MQTTGTAADAADLVPSTPGPSRVVYVGHLPHGFFEDQLRKFFAQFGTITNLRVSRNKATGKPKHYAFLEFQSPDVAAIAAEAMDGYFLFQQKLVCSLMAPSAVHPELFKGGNRKFRPPPRQKLERQRLEKARTPAELAALQQRAVAKDQERRQKLAAAGIVYDWPELALEPAPEPAAEAEAKPKRRKREAAASAAQQDSLPQSVPAASDAAKPKRRKAAASLQPQEPFPVEQTQPAAPGKQKRRQAAASEQPAAAAAEQPAAVPRPAKARKQKAAAAVQEPGQGPASAAALAVPRQKAAQPVSADAKPRKRASNGAAPASGLPTQPGRKLGKQKGSKQLAL